MAKRRRSADGDDAKRAKHLYLVLDDWEKGYSIHKIDDHAFSGAGDGDVQAQELTAPPALRLEAAKGARGALFAALGSKVLALWQPRHRPTPTFVYDTETAGLAAGPAHPRSLQTISFVLSSPGQTTLYALHGGGVHRLEERGSPELEEGEEQWAWTRLCRSLRLPFGAVPTPHPPEHSGFVYITAHALHPDGRTLFVSADTSRSGRSAGTFSLDAATGRWARHGDWLLPFQGEAHYDGELHAWVGLHSPGYVCACEVPPPRRAPQPAWELVEAAALFTADPDPERGDPRPTAALVRAGDGGELCVVEEIPAPDSVIDEVDEYELRLTTFRLKRGRRGRLRVSSRRAALSYRLHRHDQLFEAQALWI